MESNPDEAKETYAKPLGQKMWSTYGASYRAAKRLKRKDHLSIIAISFLSTYVIVLNLLQIYPFLPTTDYERTLYSFISIVASLFIIVLTLLETGQNYQLRSERLRNRAREIKILHNELQEIGLRALQDKDQAIHDLSIKYNELLRSGPENHDDIDYRSFKAMNRHIFRINIVHAYAILLWTTLSPNILYILMIIGPPLAFLFTFSSR